MAPVTPSHLFVQRFKRQLYRVVTGFAFAVCLLGAFFSRSHPVEYGWMSVLFLGSHLYLTFHKKPDLPRAEWTNLLLGTLLSWFQIYTAAFNDPIGLEGFFVLFAMTSLSVAVFSYRRALQVISVQAGVAFLAPWIADLFFDVLTGREWLYLFSMELIVFACVALQTVVAWFKEQYHQEEARRTVLEKQATTDPLTGLPNRRAMLERLGQVEAGQGCLVLLDIDHFKRINDTYGHNTGDDVLREVARLLQEHVPDVQQVSRWGGEEFVLLFENTPPFEALSLAEEVRSRLAGHPFPQVGRVTASLGLASGRSGEEVKAWIHRADQALYQAKTSGRNRVVDAGPLESGLVTS